MNACRRVWVLLLVTAAAQAAAVDPALPAYVPRTVAPPTGAAYLRPDGAIAVVGYNDMAGMLLRLSAGFAARHPGFRFAFDLQGTRTAPPALGAGRSALAPMGAEFSPEELVAYRREAGSDPLVIRVAHASLDPRALSGPLAIVVHHTSPLAALTLPEVAAIFAGRDPNRGLRPVGLSRDTALGRFFRTRVLGGGEFGGDFVGCAQSAEVMRRVGEDPQTIGFAAAMRAGPGVKVLALATAAGVPPVSPTTESLTAGHYPLDRHLLLGARLPLEPWVREFLRWVLSAEGQRLVADDSLGYLPLSALDAATEGRKVAAAP